MNTEVTEQQMIRNEDLRKSIHSLQSLLQKELTLNDKIINRVGLNDDEEKEIRERVLKLTKELK